MSYAHYSVLYSQFKEQVDNIRMAVNPSMASGRMDNPSHPDWLSVIDQLSLLFQSKDSNIDLMRVQPYDYRIQ